jgi:hypothetical protein
VKGLASSPITSLKENLATQQTIGQSTTAIVLNSMGLLLIHDGQAWINFPW